MYRSITFAVAACLAIAAGPTAALKAQGYNPDLVYPEQVSAEPVLSAEPISPGEAIELISDRLWEGEPFVFDSRLLSGYGLRGNVALISQGGQGNVVDLWQNGAGNVAVVSQRGVGNETVLSQDGSGNTMGVRLDGVGNALKATQRGNDNLYLLELDANFRNLLPVVQVGDRNQAVQIGDVQVPFGIEQRGHDMNLIIRHNGAQAVPVGTAP